MLPKNNLKKLIESRRHWRLPFYSLVKLKVGANSCASVDPVFTLLDQLRSILVHQGITALQCPRLATMYTRCTTAEAARPRLFTSLMSRTLTPQCMCTFIDLHLKIFTEQSVAHEKSGGIFLIKSFTRRGKYFGQTSCSRDASA